MSMRMLEADIEKPNQLYIWSRPVVDQVSGTKILVSSILILPNENMGYSV